MRAAAMVSPGLPALMLGWEPGKEGPTLWSCPRPWNRRVQASTHTASGGAWTGGDFVKTFS